MALFAACGSRSLALRDVIHLLGLALIPFHRGPVLTSDRWTGHHVDGKARFSRLLALHHRARRLSDVRRASSAGDLDERHADAKRDDSIHRAECINDGRNGRTCGDTSAISRPLAGTGSRSDARR